MGAAGERSTLDAGKVEQHGREDGALPALRDVLNG